MKIALVSPDNDNSRFLKSAMEANGCVVTATASESPEAVNSLSETSDFVVLNHTTSLNRRLMGKMNDLSKVVEFSPAKTPFLQSRGKIISLGLLALKDGESGFSRKIVIVGDISRNGTEGIVDKLFRGTEVLHRESEEFDKMVSELLVKPYVFSLLARKVTDLDYDPVNGEYDSILGLSRSITNYNVDYIRDLIRNNPHTGEIFSSMEENLKRVWNELSLY